MMETTTLAELKQTAINDLGECNDPKLICQVLKLLNNEVEIKVVIDIPSQDTQFEMKDWTPFDQIPQDHKPKQLKAPQ